MGTVVNYYRVWCNTDSKWEYVWDTVEPTTCPVDPVGHTIDAGKTSIQKVSEPDDPVTKTETLDTNSGVAVTPSFDIGNLGSVSFEVFALTGAHTTHVVKLQCSMNDVDWGDVAGATVTGLGSKMGQSIPTQYCRLVVDTVEGAASTVTILMQAKK